MRNNSMKNEIVYYENAHNWHNQKYLKPKNQKVAIQIYYLKMSK